MRFVPAGRVDAGLDQALHRELAHVERLLGAAGDGAPAPLRAAARAALLPGKRVRPLVALLAYRAAGGAVEGAAVEPAAAVELLHAASLCVDDVLDGSPLRRGVPSVPAAHGTRAALLAGAHLTTQALRLAAPASPGGPTAALPDWDATTGALEALVDAEARGGDPSEARDTGAWESIALGKTASLFALAGELGARRADPTHAESLRRYGEQLGLAFQAADDVLDVTGDPRLTGKPRGLDARAGAPNLARLLGVTEARAAAARRADAAAQALHPLPRSRARTALERLAREAAHRDR